MAITRAQQVRQMLRDGSMKPVEQAGVMNYMPSEMVTVPKIAKSSPDTPTAKLAYITPKEQDILIDLNLYGSLDGKPNRGPGGLPSLEGDFGSVKSDGKGGFRGDGKGPDPKLPPGVKRGASSVVTKDDEKRARKETKEFFKDKGIKTASGGNFFTNFLKTRQKGLYNLIPNNPKRELQFLSNLRITNPAKYNTLPQSLKDALEETDFDFAPSFQDSSKLSFDQFEDLTQFDDGACAQYAKDRGSPGLSVSGDMSKVGVKSVRRDKITREPIKDMFGNTLFDYGPPQDGGGNGEGSNILFPQGIMTQASSTMDQGTTTEDDDGLKLRFRAEGGPIGGEYDFESARQMYGLGKLVKKVTRTVKKIAKSPIGKAAIIGGLGAYGLGALGAKSFAPSAAFNLANIGKGFAASKGFLADKLFGPVISATGEQPFRSGGLFDKFPGGGIGAALTAASVLPLLGIGTGDESEEEAEKLLRGEGLNINEIRANPNKFLATRFMAEGGRIGLSNGGISFREYLSKQGLDLDKLDLNTLSIMQRAYDRDVPNRPNKLADGGKPEPVAKKTMPLLDMGGKEMDLRAEGGFVPIGRMEKADDVPARLSKNEFVFTADAVRNAGEGDVDKGAEVMYNMMKNLEAGGEVSEESQGMDGARRMFQTSQRLEEVL